MIHSPKCHRKESKKQIQLLCLSDSEYFSHLSTLLLNPECSLVEETLRIQALLELVHRVHCDDYERALGFVERKEEIWVLVQTLPLTLRVILSLSCPPGLQFPTFKMSNLNSVLGTSLLMYPMPSASQACSQKHTLERKSTVVGTLCAFEGRRLNSHAFFPSSLGTQFCTVDITRNLRNCPYTMTQNPWNHASD